MRLRMPVYGISINWIELLQKVLGIFKLTLLYMSKVVLGIDILKDLMGVGAVVRG